MKKIVDRLKKRSEAGKKKEYESPQLICYGTVEKLTKGTGTHGNDGAGSFTKNCWIAEAIYGVDAPRTQLVRAWLSECYEQGQPWSLIVVPLYRRFGQGIAAFLRRYPAFKSLFRPLFDLGVTRAHRDRAKGLLAAVGASAKAS